MGEKATAQDARLILQLYHVRQEREMRKARQWWLTKFWPKTASDYLKIESARRTKENNWLRQVISYWGMAASFVLHGTLSERIFLEPSFSGEIFVVYAKVQPFLPELRKRTLNPDLMRTIETVILGSKDGRELLKQVSERVVRRRKIMT